MMCAVREAFKLPIYCQVFCPGIIVPLGRNRERKKIQILSGKIRFFFALKKKSLYFSQKRMILPLINEKPPINVDILRRLKQR